MRNRVLIGLVTCAALASAMVSAQERRGQSKGELITASNVRLWTENRNTVPVCWETAGYDREKAIVRNSVAGTWEFHANVTFTGWGACPTIGTAQSVRVRISPQDATNAGAGGSARPGMAALSRAIDNNPGVQLSFNPDGSADRGRVEYIGVHEFGHVLGFLHEQDAPGNVEGPAHCPTGGANPLARPLTAYDRDSVMNYCNRDGNMTGNLTDGDIVGSQAVYGVRRRNVVSRNSCTSELVSRPVSLAAVWNDGGGASIAVFPSTLSSFGYHSQWMIRDGGWGDAIRWTSGDFNGDGRTDIGAVWNYGGSNVLSVRLSTGSGFIPVHWAIGAGGWMDSTVWLSGDFNGDGYTDMAGVWNDGGLVSIAVFPSDGTRFLYHTQWSLRDGGWGDTVKWVAGDFNGDGRTDIAGAWNNGGRTTLTVRPSLPDNRFGHEHWDVDAGRWMDATVLLPGDFDGDGLTDLAQIWNDIGAASIDVSRSWGGGFWSAQAWSTRDGGLPERLRWMTGDFNGDGRTDIGAAWDYWGTNILTVREAAGGAFVPRHWSVNAGGWMDSTAWCVGQYQ